MFRLTLFIISVLASQSIFALPSHIKLSTKLWPPYHYYNDEGKLTGLSVNIVECSLSKLNIGVTIEVVPWSRAQQHTKLGVSDGFFSASWNASRDRYATRSVDIAPQNWVWYTLNDSNMDPNSNSFKTDASIAATRGSNIAHWLNKNNYKITAETMALNNMVNMTLMGRVDAFMANELVAKEALEGSKDFFKLKKTVARSMPVGVYFNHPFLTKYPDFLAVFNQGVEECVAANIL